MALSTVEEVEANGRNWGKRVLVFTDSQAVPGAPAKGRSSKRMMNFVARRLAAEVLSTSVKVYWRYARTHWNWADAPSRGRAMGALGESKEQTALPPEFLFTSG